MSNSIAGYRDLIVWQRAMLIAEMTYGLTRAFPREEQFGLTSQARRAAAWVAANIAEGYGRGARPAYANFVRIRPGIVEGAGDAPHPRLASRLRQPGGHRADAGRG